MVLHHRTKLCSLLCTIYNCVNKALNRLLCTACYSEMSKYNLRGVVCVELLRWADDFTFSGRCEVLRVVVTDNAFANGTETKTYYNLSCA